MVDSLGALVVTATPIGEDASVMPDVLKVVLALLPAVGLFFVIRTVVGRRITQAVTLAKAEATAARPVSRSGYAAERS